MKANHFNQNRILSERSRIGPAVEDPNALYRLTGQVLLERAQNFLKFDPRSILDLNAGRGSFSRKLCEQYPKARIISVDPAETELKIARQKKSFFKKQSFLSAVLNDIPLADNSIDFIFGHGALDGLNDPQSVLEEIQRILKPGGVFLFSCLGPDTLKELRQALNHIGEQPFLAAFTDLHDWGDRVYAAKFKDPILDAEYFEFYYSDLPQLLQGIRKQSPIYTLNEMHKGLWTPRQWQALIKAYEDYRQKEGLMASVEMVYGIAWGTETLSSSQKGMETTIPLTQIRRKKDI